MKKTNSINKSMYSVAKSIEKCAHEICKFNNYVKVLRNRNGVLGRTVIA